MIIGCDAGEIGSHEGAESIDRRRRHRWACNSLPVFVSRWTMRIERAIDDRSRALKVREGGREQDVATKDPGNNLLPQNKKSKPGVLSFFLTWLHTFVAQAIHVGSSVGSL